ncbi:hypothetical protein LJ737_24230 [Hymenobacter sp. 15J16-1T3B]|uniref:hypothetical protein n=1 Tax=Hymenobacter sp. 15J16-1T3B TaxID=2886941 RepID=UPI001D101BA9|nr:hypothetical protein [Hymenobacter sp. 15J16-1T3B]MCC3160366.1 hypothetical protein [Hymenobacter sp. 15J16-1T3B]
MNGAHLHLLLNHTPILGSLFGLVLLLVALVRRQPVLVKAGLIVLLVAAALAIPTNMTGEGAEEVVEHYPGVTRTLIHEHEEAAELALWALELTGLLAVGSLLLLARGHARAALLTRLTLVGALLSFGLMARAGNLGGRIMHPETRGDAVSNALGR